jgi:hypothetical protein
MLLTRQTAERFHQRDIADDIHHLAVDGRRFVGEIMVQRFAGGGDVENNDNHAAGDHRE